MITVLEVLKRSADFLGRKGVPQPRLQAEWLLAHHLGCGRMQLYLQFERPLHEADLVPLRAMVKRRAEREPLQHILGDVDFHGLCLRVDRRALIPRPETEQLVALVLSRWSSAPAPRRILDLGTGTGAIALSLARAWPEAVVTALDVSAESLQLARENAEKLGLGGRITWVQSDWFEALPGAERYDGIVSNPPYLSEEEWTRTDPEVREHEPKRALVSEEAGLRDPRCILEGARGRLCPGGLLALEVGEAHPPALAALALGLGYTGIETLEDAAGRPRYLLARAPAG